MAVILIVEFVNPEFYYIGVQSRMEPVISKSVFLSITYIAIGAIVTYLKKQYDVTYILTKRQNDVLERKNKEIDDKNRMIEAQNTNLEKLIIDRTQQIQLQKEQLLKYAFFNSHKVRAPLSNMLGIIELLEHASLSETELSRLMKMLNVQANRLDQEIQFVQDIIHQTPHEHDYQELVFGQYEGMQK
jgi:signal transduction histidine kinase